MYKLTIKNYILITLAIIAMLLLLAECNDIKTLILSKIISLSYLTIFAYANIKNKTSQHIN